MKVFPNFLLIKIDWYFINLNIDILNFFNLLMLMLDELYFINLYLYRYYLNLILINPSFRLFKWLYIFGLY